MSYDRILRAELFRSDRFLSLSTDTHRLVFSALLTEADDFGNVEGGSRRLWRWMHTFSQVKAEQDAIKIMSELADNDLIRRYEWEGHEYWHIPRFRNQRTYQKRKYPASPWCDPGAKTGQTRAGGRKIYKTIKVIPEKLSQICDSVVTDLSIGVGVGVGVGIKTSSSSSDDGFGEFWSAYPKKVGKDAARKAWAKIKQKTEVLKEIHDSLAWQITSDQWKRDNGQFIPNPATYLNQGRWQDEQPAQGSEDWRKGVVV